MTLENFTNTAREAIKRGQAIASENKQLEVSVAHLVKGLLRADKYVVGTLLKRCGVEENAVAAAMNLHIQNTPKVEGEGQQFLSKNANLALTKAKSLMSKYEQKLISIELIFLGILDLNDSATESLKKIGVTPKKMKEAVKKFTEQPEFLGRFSTDLTSRAAEGKLDPIIGRDEEIRRILHILSRRKKNNPLLTGEPGVGKTAIIEGIAMRIANQDVPDNLKSKKIYALDIVGLLAGVKYKGEFEERLQGVIEDVKKSDGQIILFIDEIHSIIGAGGGGGGVDAANILKPALARGELRTIGATTLDEYQKYFEKDKALVRRFQTVTIDEPSVKDTISILRGLQQKYEIYHGVELLDEALVAAAELSSRYIADRFLPDKAIDLIDEAAAKLRLELDSVPESVDELKRKITQLNIEKEFLKHEENQGKKLKVVKEKIANFQKELDAIEKELNKERKLIEDIQDLKSKLEEYHVAIEVAKRESNFGDAAKYEHGLIPETEEQLQKAEAQLAKFPMEKRFMREEVTSNDVASVVARWTGIPVDKMLQSEKDKILKLEGEIGQRLIGQEEAVTAVSDAVRRSRAGLQDGQRPIGSFIFLGPTGVGKTELAKALAEVLFNDENAITRIDMSEFQERHSVSRLVGAPPGYVGYEEGGQLTEAVRRKPYSIVLLDEIEKAHPDTFNILLQVLDDGRLTDSKGRIADFRNTIIIMTSNMGAEIILDNFEDLAEMEDKKDEIIEATKQEVFELLKEDLRPEFLNRIDEKIMFRPLTKAEIKKIFMLLMRKVDKMLAKQEMTIEVSEAAQDHLADLGYDPQFGARPMKRVLQKEIINELSKYLLSDTFGPSDHILVDLKGGKLSFEVGKK